MSIGSSITATVSLIGRPLKAKKEADAKRLLKRREGEISDDKSYLEESVG